LRSENSIRTNVARFSTKTISCDGGQPENDVPRHEIAAHRAALHQVDDAGRVAREIDENADVKDQSKTIGEASRVICSLSQTRRNTPPTIERAAETENQPSASTAICGIL
jgi:hypothetical protein